MNPTEIITQAFLLFEFSIKLLCHAELGRINPAEFNNPVLIKLPSRNLLFKHEVFNSPDEIILATHNMYMLAFGFSAAALHNAVKVSGLEKRHADLCDLVYMIRCAFAHPDEMICPRWEVEGSYARELRMDLPSGQLVVNARKLHRQQFTVEHIGGNEKYFEIKDEVLRLVSNT